MSSRLLPPNRSSLERSLVMYCLPNCRCRFVSFTIRHAGEAALLPYLAWTRSVDRWDPDWSDEAKRNAVATSFVLHQRKGTPTALRQVVEPIGALSEVTEWWQRSPTGVPGDLRDHRGRQRPWHRRRHRTGAGALAR
ncbi:phage tail protein I [Pseudomonas aeruginosa]